MAKAKNETPAVGNPDDKLKALEAARLQIEKQFGQGSLMKLGNNSAIGNIEIIPSGSILLDLAVIPAAELSKYSAPNLRVRLR